MELQLFGINHKTSKVSERERFIINDTNQILLSSHLKKIFNLPDNMIPVAAIAIGHPAQQHQARTRYDSAKVHRQAPQN